MAAGLRLQLLLNVGGPERLSRAEMAEAVAEVRGFDKALIKHIPAASVRISPLSYHSLHWHSSKIEGLDVAGESGGCKSSRYIHECEQMYFNVKYQSYSFSERCGADIDKESINVCFFVHYIYY